MVKGHLDGDSKPSIVGHWRGGSIRRLKQGGSDGSDECIDRLETLLIGCDIYASPVHTEASLCAALPRFCLEKVT